MDKTRGFKFREVLKNMGARSIVVSLLVFLLTVTLTCVVGYKFYDTTKENIHLQGKVNAFEEDVQQCLQAGMNEHLSKPVDVDRLKEMLGRLLGLE